ncbi:hypothetical protein BFW01_g10980 [Lasiodiplodia theobromae]|uniref:Uncharacterized protein n=1 Tax=Lasiodiplodia theobromae TaxID=45133 RepID=A0A8H7IR44_9PEZI|nr:hypothetical protein BFW01_g10980 [Lasiodiplodia theobromae]
MAPGMKWDSEADAKLFGLFLNIFDIKVSGDMMKKLNAAMGFDAKSQAIAHRIGSVRKRAADLLSDSDGNPIKPAPLTPRGPKSGGSGTPGTRGSNRKGAASKHDSEESDDSGVGLLSAPSSAKRPRSARKAAGAKRSYKEPDTSDDEGEKKLSDEERAVASKKIKLEKEDEIKDSDGEEASVEAGTEEAQKSFFDGDGGLGEEEV